MKTVSKYLWLLALAILVIHGLSVIRNEWKRKFIHDHGETVTVKIDVLQCPAGVMTFHFGPNLFQKEIDARTCVVFNVGQAIKLKHSEQYPDMFLFVNERNPNRFLLGGLEIVLGIIGLMANWPLLSFIRKRKDFQTTS